MPQTIVVESYQEFIERHGGRPAKVSDNRWVLSDGAWATNGFGMGAPEMYEPPTEPLACLENRKQYHATKLARVKADFAELKAALLGQLDASGISMRWTWDAAEYGAPPSERDATGLPDGAVALRRLQAVVQEHRDVIAAIDHEIAAMPAAQEERRAKALEVECNCRAQKRATLVREQINSINI